MPRMGCPPASSGTWPAPLYAASVPGVPPSTCLTWFHAEQACPISRKRLLRNEEWHAGWRASPGDTSRRRDIERRSLRARVRRGW